MKDIILILETTLETVPGENDSNFESEPEAATIENPEHPIWRTASGKDNERVKTLNKQIYSIAYLKNGWRMKAEKPGEDKS